MSTRFCASVGHSAKSMILGTWNSVKIQMSPAEYAPMNLLEKNGKYRKAFPDFKNCTQQRCSS